jgi:hypothetical protein
MATELVTFLRARIDEDERAGRALGDVQAKLHDLRRSIDPNVRNGAEYVFAEGRLDPARTLADVAAKRAILDAVFHYEATIDGEWGDCCSAETIADGRCECTPVDEIPALLALVQPYAGHPEFDPAWSVSAGAR